MKLIILPGWGQDKTFWQDFAAKFPLDSELQVEVWDLPGFGDEPLVSAEWGVPEYADWVVRKIKDDEVVLLGHSFGGRVASYVAAQRPPWLKGLVLYASPALYRPQWHIRWRIKLYKFLKLFVPLRLLKRVFYGAELSSADSSGMGKVFRRVVAFDQTEFLPKIDVPTLLIWGDKDEYPRQTIVKEMQRLIPGSQLEIVPGEGHNLHLQQPVLFYGLVVKFIRSLP